MPSRELDGQGKPVHGPADLLDVSAVLGQVEPRVHGLGDLVDMDHRISDELWLEPTPGHTPGHVSVRLRSHGAEAVITGDLMHCPVQVAEPEWGSHFDSDVEQARKTRRAFCERYADRDVVVLGTHFHHPTAGRIVRHGSSWRFLVTTRS